jgi:hypothetical protein
MHFRIDGKTETNGKARSGFVCADNDHERPLHFASVGVPTNDRFAPQAVIP